MYQVLEEKFGSLTCLRLLNSQTQTSFSILPELGATPLHFHVNHQGQMLNIFPNYTQEDEFRRETRAKYINSKLFPFPNRIKDGKFQFEGTDHQLNVNHPQEGHALHGFVYDQVFEILDSSTEENLASVVLKYDYWGDFNGFPYPFSLLIEYTLEGRSLRMNTTVVNTGDSKLPFGDGWHPYFYLGDSVNNYELAFKAENMLEVDERMIPTGNQMAFNDFNEARLIGDYNFDSCFTLPPSEDKHTLMLSNPGNQLKLKLSMNADQQKYNYLQIYIPEDRQSIAIEPMTCPPNVFNNLKDLIVLQPEATYSVDWEIEVL